METISKENLNQRLLEVCITDPVDYESAEELLKQGAEPLGKVIDAYGEEGNLYTEIVSELFDNDRTRKDFYSITALFLRYGMDISKPAVPYDNGVAEIIIPLWYFAFFSNETVFQTLMLLLDNGLSPDDAAECWSHALFDFSLGESLDDPFVHNELYDYCKKVMLIASYPNILQNDEDLKRIIWYDKNDYDLIKFRQWDAFTYDIDTSHCQRHPEVYRSIITIIEKESEQPVWKFGISITPDEIVKEKQ